MRVLSATFLVLVILAVSNCGVDAIIDKFGAAIDKGLKKMGDAANKFSDVVMGQAVECYCGEGADLGEFAAKGMGFLECDKDHKVKDYCKFVDDTKMVHDMICCLGEEQRKEAFKIAIGCFVSKGQDCLEKWGTWITSLKEVADMITKKKDRK